MRGPIQPRTANETTSTAAKLIHSFFMNLPFKTMAVYSFKISGGDHLASDFSHRSQANPPESRYPSESCGDSGNSVAVPQDPWNQLPAAREWGKLRTDKRCSEWVRQI